MNEMDTTCVTWRKSTRSNGSGNCVEVAADLGGKVGLRDSKDPSGPILTFAPAAWATFVRATRAEGRRR
ncbi:DUF397 domain-containing protein [Salinispora arenicola]|uniref:Uncharacterized protein DUF397 n=3 Tax=Salinispora arenicola TaxID=168697 RepID=A0A542XQV4_SALAC|nr:DUF397 domain-containing protein [Salinispora arenicola]MCN0176980.1 DUF397 domain-containing protein [Salinispora arenicola]TQL38235.1 uncharacterized protein DUF397 [Salinispora arenicola]